MLLQWNTLTTGHRAYMFTGQRRHRVNVCVVLAHFYRRKPNWSARVYYYYYHHHPLLLLLSLSLFFFPFLQEFISRIHPPRLGSNPGFHATLATPYRVLNTNRDASFFASLPNKTFLNAIITINEEEANGCIGPLLYSPLLSLLSFRSSGEPLKEPRPLVLFLSFRRLSPPPHFYSKYRGSATREKRRRRDEEDEKVEEEEEVSRPIVMHDYSLRYRGAPRGYIPRFTIFMPDSGQSGQSEFRGRARRRVVELWKAAAPCHCLKFSYPRRVGCFIQLRARTPCLSFTSGEQGYKLIGGDAVYNFFFPFL